MLQDLQVTYFCDSSMFGKKVTKHIPPKWWWKKREKWWSTMVVSATRSPTKQLQEKTAPSKALLYFSMISFVSWLPWLRATFQNQRAIRDFTGEHIQAIPVAQDSEYQNTVEPSSKTHLQGINTCKNIGAKYRINLMVLYTNKKALPTHHPTNYVVISKRKTTQLQNLSKLVGFQPWVHRKEASP